MPYYYKTHQTLNQNTCICTHGKTRLCMDVKRVCAYLLWSTRYKWNVVQVVGAMLKFSFASDCFIRNDVVIWFLCVNNLSSQTPTSRNLSIHKKTTQNLSKHLMHCNFLLMPNLFIVCLSHWQHFSIVF